MSRLGADGWESRTYPDNLAYYILAQALVRLHGKESTLAIAIGHDRKGLTSLFIYTAAVMFSFFLPAAAMALYVVVAVIWFIPDRRIEARVGDKPAG